MSITLEKTTEKDAIAAYRKATKAVEAAELEIEKHEDRLAGLEDKAADLREMRLELAALKSQRREARGEAVAHGKTPDTAKLDREIAALEKSLAGEDDLNAGLAHVHAKLTRARDRLWAAQQQVDQALCAVVQARADALLDRVHGVRVPQLASDVMAEYGDEPYIADANRAAFLDHQRAEERAILSFGQYTHAVESARRLGADSRWLRSADNTIETMRLRNEGWSRVSRPERGEIDTFIHALRRELG